MATADTEAARPRLIRSGVIAVFGLLGPAVGTAALLLLFVGEGVLRPSGDSFSVVRAFLPAMSFGYLFGLGPAFAAGLIYALVPRVARRVGLSPFYGTVATWLFYKLLPLSEYAERGLTDNWLLLSAGGAAALACALLVRKLGIDGWRA